MLSMDLGISGKVALVTAGTKGIGLGIAHALAAEGARAAVAARTRVGVTGTAQSMSGAREVASQGVTVSCVAPGSILWEGGGWYRRQQADPAGIDAFVRAEMPLGRFGVVEEVANVVAFVCSQQASLLNGACIAVDGGQSRSNI